MMSSICPFAKRVSKSKYYCSVLKKTLSNLMGVYTSKYESCEVYQEAMERIEVFRSCLLKALKLGEEYVEELFARIDKDGYFAPTLNDCKRCDEVNSKCICNINGFCVLKLQRLNEASTPLIEIEPVTLDVNRHKRALPLPHLRGRKSK